MCRQVMRLQGKTLHYLDVGGCISLHDLQISGHLEDLVAAAQKKKVRTALTMQHFAGQLFFFISRLQALFKCQYCPS